MLSSPIVPPTRPLSTNSWITLALLAVACLGTGCEAVIGDPGASVGEVPPRRVPPPEKCEGEECLEFDEAPTPITRAPRLTHIQWENTVMDLLELDAPPGLAQDFNPDARVGTFSSNVERLKINGGLYRDYQRAAEQVAQDVATDGAKLARVADAGAGAGAFLTSFVSRAYRRPASDTEVTRAQRLFNTGSTHYPEMDAFAAGVRVVIEGVLQSPNFLYRVELSDQVEGDVIRITGFEVASRLSYLLWDTMPDEALRAAAMTGALDTEEGVVTAAKRLLEHERARASFGRFHVEAMGLASWVDIAKDTDLIPSWHPGLNAMMITESRMFLDNLVFSNAPVGDLATSTTAFINADLAEIYGATGTFGDEFTETTLDANERAGFMTRIGFLAKYATRFGSDPIHRGVHGNTGMICREIIPLPALPDDLMPVGDTTREQVNSITGPGTCGESCHGGIINPIGFGLENYDAIGRYRTMEGDFPVDASSEYVFDDGVRASFDGPVELSQALADHPALHRCYASRFLEFAYGRAEQLEDAPLVGRLGYFSHRGEVNAQDVVTSILAGRGFRFRSTQEPVEETEE